LPPTNTPRKGARAEPYVNHLVEVARLLADATSGDDPALVAAGLLHDTLEDTCTTFEELEREFGADVAGLVQEVTDNKNLKKEERKRLQIETAGKKSPRARLIKIADKTSNLRSILSSPPTDWSTRRKREYFDWAKGWSTSVATSMRSSRSCSTGPMRRASRCSRPTPPSGLPLR
jgi:GTP diphosphokinase / guanosine-3',5'-bis(diphosphate) 3'-diphosphatase